MKLYAAKSIQCLERSNAHNDNDTNTDADNNTDKSFGYQSPQNVGIENSTGKSHSSAMRYPTDGKGFNYDDILKLNRHYGMDSSDISVMISVSRSRYPITIGRNATWHTNYLTLHALLGHKPGMEDVMFLTEEAPEITNYDQANLVYLLHILRFPIDTLRYTKSFRTLFYDFSLELVVNTLVEMNVLNERFNLSGLKRRGIIKDADMIKPNRLPPLK
jgi:hypothetical protein